jgi:hypothetical protein
MFALSSANGNTDAISCQHCLCWSIWMVRNHVIFEGIPHSVNRCKSIFEKEFALVILRAKVALHPRIDLWLEAFV